MSDINSGYYCPICSDEVEPYTWVPVDRAEYESLQADSRKLEAVRGVLTEAIALFHDHVTETSETDAEGGAFTAGQRDGLNIVQGFIDNQLAEVLEAGGGDE